MDAKTLRRMERLNYLLGGILIVAAALLLSQRQALGILVGVLLGCINFTLLRRIGERWIAEAKKNAASHGSVGKSGYFLIPKMAALLAAVFLALKFLPIAPEFLAIGFSVFLVSIALEVLRAMAAPSGEADTEEPESQQDSSGDRGPEE